jgi:hypothetical protein
VVIGTAADIVDQMQGWQAAQAADGYNIIPSHMPSGIDDFVELVVPDLQRPGLFRRASKAYRNFCGYAKLRPVVGMIVAANTKYAAYRGGAS